VATDVGDVAVLMADTGVLVPRANADALAQGVAGLVALDPARRRQMGQQARARIGARFTMGCVRARFERIYEGVIARGEL
jgi:glycosyltransferase involved in cell wall biosynthesis